jgi:hypothetical protein
MPVCHEGRQHSSVIAWKVCLRLPSLFHVRIEEECLAVEPLLFQLSLGVFGGVRHEDRPHALQHTNSARVTKSTMDGTNTKTATVLCGTALHRNHVAPCAMHGKPKRTASGSLPWLKQTQSHLYLASRAGRRLASVVGHQHLRRVLAAQRTLPLLAAQQSAAT